MLEEVGLGRRLLPCFPCFVGAQSWGRRREPTTPSGEEGTIIALESAWDQANLLAENLVYGRYSGSIRTKQPFLAGLKGLDIAREQINNQGVAVHLYGNDVALRTGIYREKGMQKGKTFRAETLLRLAVHRL